MRLDICPLKLGETMDGTAEDGTTLINKPWLGQIFEVPANNISAQSIRGAKKRLTGRTIKVVLLRNTSGVTLYGKRLGHVELTAGYDILGEVADYAITTAQKNVVIIDPYLTTTGVADDDIFLGVLEGPVTVKMQTLAAASSVVVTGAKLTAGSGAASSRQTNSTGGAVTGPGGVGMTTTPYVDTIVGTAMSGRTTADTGADVLINACIRTF